MTPWSSQTKEFDLCPLPDLDVHWYLPPSLFVAGAAVVVLLSFVAAGRTRQRSSCRACSACVRIGLQKGPCGRTCGYTNPEDPFQRISIHNPTGTGQTPITGGRCNDPKRPSWSSSTASWPVSTPSWWEQPALQRHHQPFREHRKHGDIRQLADDGVRLRRVGHPRDRALVLAKKLRTRGDFSRPGIVGPRWAAVRRRTWRNRPPRAVGIGGRCGCSNSRRCSLRGSDPVLSRFPAHPVRRGPTTMTSSWTPEAESSSTCDYAFFWSQKK